MAHAGATARSALSAGTRRIAPGSSFEHRWPACTIVALTVAWTIVWGTPKAQASPQDLFGIGAVSPGLAMTGVAWADGDEAALLNPAGLGARWRTALSLGASANAPRLRIDGRRHALGPARGLGIGFVVPLPFDGPLHRRLALGGSFYTPAQSLLRGEVAYAETVQWPVLARTDVVGLAVGLGYDASALVRGLRLGAGVRLLADLLGELAVRLDETGTFSSEVETELLARPSPLVGAQWRRGSLVAGLVYRHALSSRMSLDVTVRDLPVRVPPLSVGGLVHYEPASVAAELAWSRARWRLVVHATWRRWSQWPGSQQPTSRSSYLAPAPDFDDTLSPRVAVERTICLRRLPARLRAGYAFEPSPAPVARQAPQRTADGRARTVDGEPVLVPLRIVDGHRHVATVGWGLDWALERGARLALDLYAQVHALVPRTHAIDGPGGASPMRSSGMLIGAGWTARLQW
ncbi:MAG: hypothetical protein NZ898_00285 [Myxococcota bacterium]|nr:hypothetical protein [Myxococcota bacterium]MDW8361982.1 hypothetical protein [Myxococcales bacterium]